MYGAIVDLFRRDGAERVIAGDEFGDVEIEIPLDDLMRQMNGEFPYGVRRIRNLDATLLVNTCWDRFFTLLATSAEQAAALDLPARFEGFWAGKDTTTSWFGEPPIELARSASQ